MDREDKELLVQLCRLHPAQEHPAKVVKRGCNLASLFSLVMNPDKKAVSKCPKKQRWPNEESSGS